MSRAYRTHGLSLSFNAISATSHGMIQMFDNEEMADRSLNFSDTQVRMSKLMAKRNWEGIAKRLAWKTLNPKSRRLKVRYVLIG